MASSCKPEPEIVPRLGTGCAYIDGYIEALRSGKRRASKEMLLACDLVERKLAQPGVRIETAKIARAKELIEKYFFPLMDWELFILALVHCFLPDGTLLFTEFLVMMGRGNGKNGFIAGLAWYLTTPDHGVKGYNVDIIANSGDQAKTSFDDVYNMLDRQDRRIRRIYYWSKELILCRGTGSYIKYNASNPRTKDGKRSACLIFDEEHEYENDAAIRVFRSGFGKREHSRVFKITTNGYVRGGVLDDDIDLAKDVLNGEADNVRLCPLIYKLDSDEEVDDPENWVKACPSLPYLKALRVEMEQEAAEMSSRRSTRLDFMVKRMNLAHVDTEVAVTEWANVKSTSRALPDMAGWSCTAGIDYASVRDWVSVDLHFKRGDERFDISHSWVCLQNPDLGRVKAPWRDWAEVTPVDDVEIAPERIAAYLAEQAQRYHIRKIALDNFRFALMRKALEDIGFDPKERRNVYLVRPSDVMKVQPVVDSCFSRQLFTWGDTPSLRWATNNTKLIRSGKKDGTDTGNHYYGKIEGKSRKTDPFMALVAAMVVEGEIPEAIPEGFDLGVIT